MADTTTTPNWTPRQAELYALARAAGDRWQVSWNAGSGADQAEGELSKYLRECYCALAADAELERAIAAMDQKWRAYATGQNAKVAAAPKIKRGPSSGHSVIGHRWVSPDLAQTTARHVRDMVRIIDARLAGEGARHEHQI